MIQTSQFLLSPEEFKQFKEILADPARLAGLYHILQFGLLMEEGTYQDAQEIERIKKSISV